jgi:hypothetical protein
MTLVLCLAAGTATADSVSGSDAFEQLKMLAGSWSGSATGEGEEAEAEAEMVDKVVHDFRVSAAGTVVMETMGPDSEYEMINMYHLDGDELVLTHYCSSGNQPLPAAPTSTPRSTTTSTPQRSPCSVTARSSARGRRTAEGKRPAG